MKAPARAWVLMSVATVAVLATLAGAGLLLRSAFTHSAQRVADNQALAAVDLMARVGAQLPDLRPDLFRKGLANSQRHRLDAALARGRTDGVVFGMALYDRSGEMVYGNGIEQGMSSALPRRFLDAALAGRPTTLRLTGKPRDGGAPVPMLAAVQPLRQGSRTFGVMEIWHPLAPLLAQASADDRRITWELVIGVLALWLAASPLLLRAARAAAEQWVPGRSRLVRSFARALDQDEIVVLFQPQVTSATETPAGAEALVRWRRGGSLASPDEFLPAIEGTRLMPALTDRVLEIALSELAALSPAWPDLRMSVNCSATDLGDPCFPTRVAAALERSGIDGHRLTVEVTETAVVSDHNLALGTLRELSSLGIALAIDDFGTGHSSISRLHALPMEELKIDRSFMGPDDRSRSYVTGLTSFAHGVGLRVVAEGVEDRDTMRYVASIGCELVQGYYVAKPLTGGQLRTWLEQTRCSIAGVDPAKDQDEFAPQAA